MPPDQLGDLDHVSSLRESLDYASTPDSIQQRCALDRSSRSVLHNSHLEDSAICPVRLVGIYWALTWPVQATSPVASTPANQPLQHARQRNPGCAKIRQ